MGVGGVLILGRPHPRGPHLRRDPGPPPRERPRVTHVRWAIVMCLLALLASCGPETSRTVPAELLGRWTTSEPKYADTFFELQPDTLLLGLAGGQVDTRTITKVEKLRQDGETLFTVYYVDPSDSNRTEIKLAFFFEAGAGGVIRWKNQKGIAWTRRVR